MGDPGVRPFFSKPPQGVVPPATKAWASLCDAGRARGGAAALRQHLHSSQAHGWPLPPGVATPHPMAHSRSEAVSRIYLLALHLSLCGCGSQREGPCLWSTTVFLHQEFSKHELSDRPSSQVSAVDHTSTCLDHIPSLPAPLSTSHRASPLQSFPRHHVTRVRSDRTLDS